MKKQMKVARGTERTRRRVGLHQGWRVHGNGPKMQPPAVPVVVLESGWSTSWQSDSKGKAKNSKSAKLADKLIEQVGEILLTQAIDAAVKAKRAPRKVAAGDIAQ